LAISLPIPPDRVIDCDWRSGKVGRPPEQAAQFISMAMKARSALSAAAGFFVPSARASFWRQRMRSESHMRSSQSTAAASRNYRLVQIIKNRGPDHVAAFIAFFRNQRMTLTANWMRAARR